MQLRDFEILKDTVNLQTLDGRLGSCIVAHAAVCRVHCLAAILDTSTG